MGPQPPFPKHSNGCRRRREDLTDTNVKSQSLKFGHKLLSHCLRLVGAESQLQVGSFEPSQTHIKSARVFSEEMQTKLASNQMFSVVPLNTHLLTASTEPGMATPSPSPLSYKTPHMSSMTPFKLVAQLGQPVSAMTRRLFFCACAGGSQSTPFSRAGTVCLNKLVFPFC